MIPQLDGPIDLSVGIASLSCQRPSSSTQEPITCPQTFQGFLDSEQYTPLQCNQAAGFGTSSNATEMGIHFSKVNEELPLFCLLKEDDRVKLLAELLDEGPEIARDYLKRKKAPMINPVESDHPFVASLNRAAVKLLKSGFAVESCPASAFLVPTASPFVTLNSWPHETNPDMVRDEDEAGM